MYIQTNWLKDGNDWYFFDEHGYMVTNDWAKWSGNYYYFGNDGKMWKNKSTPDGHKVNKEGIRINQIKSSMSCFFCIQNNYILV